MSVVDKPNVTLPLAASYNERGIDGYATTVTSGRDQRKINSMYEPVKNAMTGKGTLYLTKRPGIVDASVTLNNSASSTPYLITAPPLGTSGSDWVISYSGNTTSVSNTTTTTAIQNVLNTYPAFVGRTAVSTVDTIVLQIRLATGTFAQRVYYSTAIGTWTEIVDADFTALVHRGQMIFMDGFAFIMDSSNRVWNSDPNSLSGWTATSFLTKQITQDNPAGLARLGNQILAFGDNSVEVLYNAGNATASPLTTIPSLAAPIGLSALSGNQGTSINRHYTCTLGKKLYFIGRDSGGSPSSNLWMYDGSTFSKVSSPFIDKILQEGIAKNIGVIGVNGKSAIAICLTGPTTTTQIWLMYFPEWNDWFEWTSSYVQPICSIAMNPQFSPYSNFIGIGNVTAQTLSRISTASTWIDGTGSPYVIPWTHQFVLPSDGNERQTMPYLGLKGDTATSAQSILVEKSDDDYVSFQTLGNIDMTTATKKLHRCGSWQGHRAIRLSHTGNTEVRLEQFLARIE